METLVLCSMVVVLLCFALKLSLLSKRQRWGLIIMAALFVGLSWSWAVEQSRTQIQAWLNNPELMRDTSVLLSFDLTFLFVYCVTQVAPKTPRNRRERILQQLLALYPGLLIALVLFSLLVLCIFSLPGVDFALTAWSLALLLLPGLWACAAFLRWLLPEKELRLELLFLLALLLCVLGVVVTVNGGSSITVKEDLNLLSHALVLLLLFSLVGLGYGLHKAQQFWQKRKNTKRSTTR